MSVKFGNTVVRHFNLRSPLTKSVTEPILGDTSIVADAPSPLPSEKNPSPPNTVQQPSQDGQGIINVPTDRMPHGVNVYNNDGEIIYFTSAEDFINQINASNERKRLMQREDTAVRRLVADMRSAGINPASLSSPTVSASGSPVASPTEEDTSISVIEILRIVLAFMRVF